MPNPDVSLLSTPTLTGTTLLNGVLTTMDTVQLTILDPNQRVVIGPVVPTAITTGTYQFTVPLGTLKLPGKWVSVWYGQSGQQANQEAKVFTVGTVYE